MALSEFEIKKCERELEAFMAMRRPPVQIRPQLDLGYRVENQSIEIFEIRPQWQNPSETMELPVAKTSYVKAKNCWKCISKLEPDLPHQALAIFAHAFKNWL